MCPGTARGARSGAAIAPLAASFALAACASSLHAAKPLAPGGASLSFEEALARADAAWAQRAEPAQVEAATALYVEAAKARPDDPRGYAGAIRGEARLLGRETDSERKAALAVRAVELGQQCELGAPQHPLCDYWLAAALGLQAREKISTAHDALPHMVELLQRAKRGDPQLDGGGPSRLLALLLLRAPPWPLGPGDVEGGLTEATDLVKLVNGDARNQLALGEALKKNGRPEESRRAYEAALRLAEASTDPDAPGWAADAREALH